MNAIAADDFLSGLTAQRSTAPMGFLPGIGNEAAAYFSIEERVLRAGGTRADAHAEFEGLINDFDENGAFASDTGSSLWAATLRVANALAWAGLGIYLAFLVANGSMIARLVTTVAPFIRF